MTGRTLLKLEGHSVECTAYMIPPQKYVLVCNVKLVQNIDIRLITKIVSIIELIPSEQQESSAVANIANRR